LTKLLIFSIFPCWFLHLILTVNLAKNNQATA
jgi:hypothetical protein